jgi:thiosulfate dehydrogenase [quinone] large subunit
MSAAGLKSYQANGLIVMRILIGWHFLYEGVIKVYNPLWTAKGYLLSADGFLKELFINLSGDGIIGTVDFLNIAALMLVGIGLLLGYAEKLVSWIGIGLLLLYYLAHPAFPGLEQVNVEGNYWIINKNLIEAAALYVLAVFPTGHLFGISRLFNRTSQPQTN